MSRQHKALLATTIFTMCTLAFFTSPLHAGTSLSDRMAVQAGVKTEIAKDLASLYSPHERLSGRTCLDGRPVDGFQGEILEYWVNLEWCAV